MKNTWQTITGWAAFAPLYMQMVDQTRGPAQFVEVGSWLGKSAVLMAELIESSGKAIKLECVDPWIDGGPDLRDTEYFKSLIAPPYDTFLANTRPWAQIIRPMRMMSVAAAQLHEDESVDFIMLDGDHSYEAVYADIVAWAPKMKPYAVMSGDDYTWPGVQKAVKEIFGSRVQSTIVHRDKRNNYRLEASYWVVQL